MAPFLPPEIRQLIFQYCPTISTAANLAQTSKDFHASWITDYQKTCTNILQNTLEGHQDALALAKAQIKSKAAAAPAPSNSAEEQHHLEFKSATVHILANAKKVEKAYTLFPKAVRKYWHDQHPMFYKNSDPPEVSLTPTERARFVKTYYSIWLLRTPGYLNTAFHHREKSTIMLVVYWLSSFMARDLRGNEGSQPQPLFEDLWSVLLLPGATPSEPQPIIVDVFEFRNKLASFRPWWVLYDYMRPRQEVKILRDDYRWLLDEANYIQAVLDHFASVRTGSLGTVP
ncbi:MAG: hypothetical protein Q9169_007472 [Polycauliona sp. 2 TL-2023]